MNKTEIRSMFIECREWFDKSGANTYHSISLWINGRQVASEGMTYGYGDQYLTTALELLIDLGFDFDPKRALWWQLKQLGADLYTSRSNVGKRDLFKTQRDPLVLATI